MSLNGYINVNDQAVGYWEAVRGKTLFQDVHEYACVVYYRNTEGHPMHAEFSVAHAESWGAVRLAHQVLGTGMKKLKGYPPGEVKDFPV